MCLLRGDRRDIVLVPSNIDEGVIGHQFPADSPVIIRSAVRTTHVWQGRKNVVNDYSRQSYSRIRYA